MDDGLYRRVIAGDLLHKRTGGMFDCTEPTVDEARLLVGELCATGPMFGDRMRRPAEATAAAEREDAVLAGAGLARDSFAAVRAIAEGTRRDAAIAIGEPRVSIDRASTGDAVAVAFALPSGAYATAVMREIMKAEATVSPDPATAESGEDEEAAPTGDGRF
jgi:tRNA pseudouridine13 synthase